MGNYKQTDLLSKIINFAAQNCLDTKLDSSYGEMSTFWFII